MTLQEWLKTATEKLSKSEIETARLDIEVLLADALNQDRSWVLAHPEHVLQGSDLRKLDEQIERRAQHVPLAYIRGKQEFYGREFLVSQTTLTPRPETEAMIEILKKLKSDKIIDVGTGSGCIGITAKLELRSSSVLLTDISTECLAAANENAHILQADIEVQESDLLQDIAVKKLSGATVCCNLPYVPDNYNINKAAAFEPGIALFGGPDGLDCYRQFFEQIISLPQYYKPDYILTESLIEQQNDLSEMAKIAGYKFSQTVGLVQLFENKAR